MAGLIEPCRKLTRNFTISFYLIIRDNSTLSSMIVQEKRRTGKLVQRARICPTYTTLEFLSFFGRECLLYSDWCLALRHHTGYNLVGLPSGGTRTQGLNVLIIWNQIAYLV